MNLPCTENNGNCKPKNLTSLNIVDGNGEWEYNLMCTGKGLIT